jgi:transposase
LEGLAASRSRSLRSARRQRCYRYPAAGRWTTRAALDGIVCVLATGIAWEQLSQRLGYGSRMIC